MAAPSTSRRPRTGAFRQPAFLIIAGKRRYYCLPANSSAAVKQDRVIGKDRIVPSARLRFLLMSSVSNTGVGPAARNLRLQKLSVPSQRRERAAVDQKQTRSGTQFAADHSQSGPRRSATANSTRSIQGAIAGNGRTEAYEKIYEFASRRVSIDDFVNEVQRRFSNATSGLRVNVSLRSSGFTAAKSPGATSSPPAISSFTIGANFCASYAVEALTRPTYHQADFPRQRQRVSCAA